MTAESRPNPPGWGTLEYAEAVTQAAAYLASRAAGGRLKGLISQVREFNPLTLEIVRWLLNQSETRGGDHHRDACRISKPAGTAQSIA